MALPKYPPIQPGAKFGFLTVISEGPRAVGRSGKKLRQWECECICGKRAMHADATLKIGRAQSCGCRKGALIAERVTRHGMSRSKMHKLWTGMLQRCENPNFHAYDRYGGRGIKVCARWHRFENFLADMGEKPEGMSLDRIDNDKGYSPGNCRWATTKEQALNRPDNARDRSTGRYFRMRAVRDALGLAPAAAGEPPGGVSEPAAARGRDGGDDAPHPR